MPQEGRDQTDHPFSAAALRVRPWLTTSARVMRFYYVVPQWLFLTAPLAYLLVGIAPVQATPESMAAYALPHFLHGYLVHARLHGGTRLTLWRQAKECVLSLYLLVPTALAYLRTRVARLRANAMPPHGAAARLWAIIAALNAAGLAAGAYRFSLEDPASRQITLVYLAWCAAILLLQLSRLAVAEEARQIHWYKAVRATMPAMVKLPFGRTLACTTVNFPAPSLVLRLPVAVTPVAGSTIGVSIFQGQREYAFPARVVSQQNGELLVTIDDKVRAEYAALGTGVLSRAQDWPKWLAGPHADRPLPEWLRRAVTTALIAALDLATNSMQFLRWSHLINRIRSWNQK